LLFQCPDCGFTQEVDDDYEDFWRLRRSYCGNCLIQYGDSPPKKMLGIPLMERVECY